MGVVAISGNVARTDLVDELRTVEAVRQPMAGDDDPVVVRRPDGRSFSALESGFENHPEVGPIRVEPPRYPPRLIRPHAHPISVNTDRATWTTIGSAGAVN
jgi:hypothetical protein